MLQRLAPVGAFVRRHFRVICEVGAVLACLGILSAMLERYIGAQGFMTPGGQPVFGDFLAFWTAGKFALAGNAAQVHDPAIVHAFQAQEIPGLKVVSTWNSPPPFLLLTMLLGLMSYPDAAFCFIGMSFAIYLIGARILLPDWRSLIFAVTVPAAFYEFGSFQTGLLIGGLTAIILYWQDKRPLVAGALIAILAIKPHMALLWPLYLIVTGRWRMFFAAAVATAAFVIAAGLVFGIESYERFLANLGYTQNLIANKRVAIATFGSLFGNLIAIGADKTVAAAAQAVNTLAALALAAVVWRRGESTAVKGAAFCAATMLSSPYLFFYDATLLAVGAALMGAPRNKVEGLACIGAWAAGLSVTVGFIQPLPVVPLCSWLLLIAAARRGALSFAKTEAPPAAPAPHM